MAFGMVVPKSNPAVPAPYAPGSAVDHGSPADPAAVNAAPALPAPACPASASSHTASAISAPASAFMEAAVIAFADMLSTFALSPVPVLQSAAKVAKSIALSAICSAAMALSAIFADVIASALIALAVMALFEMVATFTSSLVVPPAYPVPSNMSSQLSAAVVSPLIWVTLTFGNVVPYFQSK